MQIAFRWDNLAYSSRADSYEHELARQLEQFVTAEYGGPASVVLDSLDWAEDYQSPEAETLADPNTYDVENFSDDSLLIEVPRKRRFWSRQRHKSK